ncbi:uncharacterized protein LOC112588859 [Harpegnathos saltator]|nr:uncharacterized protein LOC112588859 [Harpegnathos saltator]
MNEHVAKQNQLRRLILRALDNFKKIGKTNLTPAKVRSRISSLKDSWSRFLDGHATLCKVVPEASQASLDYFRDELFDDTEEAFQSALDFMAESLEELEPPVSPNSSLGQSPIRLSKPATTLNHLPPISLPPYDGSFESWESFRDRFTALIIENRELSNVTRMHFLTSCVAGRARECIRDLAVTADNFETAWNLLTARFENKRRILNGHLTSILNLPVISRESASELSALCDKVTATIAAITNMQRSPAQLWNDMLVHIVVNKLDSPTRKAWNLRSGPSDELPSFDELKTFLASRARALEDLTESSAGKTHSRLTQKVNVAIASTSKSCPLCKDNHPFSACSLFVKNNAIKRRELASRHRRCFNYLSDKHNRKDCKSQYSCRECHRKHHTLLHVGAPATVITNVSPQTESSACEAEAGFTDSQIAPPLIKTNSLLTATRVRSQSHVLLATAIVKVSCASGRSVSVRALLDQGSEVTFISESVAQMLRIKRIRKSVTVSAVGGLNAGTVHHAADIKISSHGNSPTIVSTIALILPNLTSYAPKRVSDIASCSHLNGLQWADSDPLSNVPIHIIIGADLYGSILLEGLRKGKATQPIAQNIIFGWILSGPLDHATSPSAPTLKDSQSAKDISVFHCLTLPSLENAIRKFWADEEIQRPIPLSIEDEQCDEYFRSSHSRTADGRYIVRLPFKNPSPILIGDSRGRAEKLLNSLLHRLKENETLAAQYKEFLAEYEQLGHMRRAPVGSTSLSQCVYLPHHPVVRDNSVTTRVRVVFNASFVTSNGTSLNDHLLIGPKLQLDLPAVILKWRQFKYVYAADVTKMYRQILIDPRDVNFQRILWKSANEAVPIE